jgi:hypothetical protein
LKYTYRYRSQFGEPNGKWLEAIAATADDLLGAYTKVEDEAMNIAFGARWKKRLNTVFDVIGFAYPDYCFLAQKHLAKKKIALLTPSTTPQPMKMKIVTHRMKSYVLERAAILPAAGISKIEVVESTEDIFPTSEVIPAAVAKVPTIQLEKTEPQSSKTDQQLKLQSPPTMPGLSKTTTVPAATPKKGRRTASVLDDVLKPSKMTTPAPTRVSKDKFEELGEDVAASAAPACAKDGPSETRPIKQVKESLPEKLTLPIPEMVSTEDLDFIIRHASGKQLTQRQVVEAQHYAKELKYPRGSLVYEGDEEYDFLYCLLDSKEIDVCREMMDKMGYPKLEFRLSLMSKDHLADNLAYNSLKVCAYYPYQSFGNHFKYIICSYLINISFIIMVFLSKALKAQKDCEDESTKIAFGNLRSEIITLRNEALEKDKIMLSLVERLKASEASLAKFSEVDQKFLNLRKKKKQMQIVYLIWNMPCLFKLDCIDPK